MPGPMKRTRSSNHNDENDSTNPNASPFSTSSTPARRRTTSTIPSSTTTPTATTPSVQPVTPTRPTLTRSASTLGPRINSPLTRSNSLFTPSTRRAANANTTLLGLPGPAPMTGRAGGSGGVGTLTRTQSTPSIASPSSLKSSVAGSGGSDSRGKGNDDPDFEAGGPRRLGKGKENIPPSKDAEDSEGNARKRLRVARRSSASTRGRSGSVSSMRSESVSGRLPSLAPSSSSSFSHRGSRLPSPTPSISSATTYSFDSIPLTSPDLDHDDQMDLDKTPTKPKARATPRKTFTLPTPPPSSPSVMPDELDATAERMGLVRMKSDLASSVESLEDTDIEDDEEPTEKSHRNPYKQLKSYLRLSNAANQVIVGRDEEQIALKAYLGKTIDIDAGLYVSGPPGTGKTATVTGLGREKRSQGWRVVELGCMGLKVTDMWRRLGEEMGCGRSEHDVQEFLKSSRVQTLIILDEIDSLLPPPPTTAPPATSHLFSKLFSLPYKTSGQVKLVAISNTLDLTLRARLVLAEGSTPIVLPFKAYAGSDMIGIVANRLAEAGPIDEETSVKVDPKAVELLTKKVEAQNGDLRMCLGVLSSAVSLAEVEWTRKTKQVAESGSETTVPLIKISLAHTIKAFNSHTQQLKAAAGSGTAATNSAVGKKIRSVPLHGKMVLVSILVFVSRVRAGLAGCPGTSAASSSSNTPTSTPAKNMDIMTTSSLYATYVQLLSHHTSPFPPNPESDYRDLLSNLEVLGLISLAMSISMTRSGSGASARKTAQGQKIDLCVREDEIKDGLGLMAGGEKGRGLAEEEVGNIWEREEGRIKRANEKERMKAQSVAEQQDRFDF